MMLCLREPGRRQWKLDQPQSFKPLEEIIASRRAQALDRSDFVSLLLRILFLALAVWLLFTQVFLITQAQGNTMFPSVKDGDLVFGFRLQGEYLKGDVVIYSYDNQLHIGRIAAGPNDNVDISEDGELLVNGTPQTGEILYPTYSRDGTAQNFRVPEDSVYILGDYRTQSMDSRDFGSIPMEELEAKVITILRRRGL